MEQSKEYKDGNAIWVPVEPPVVHGLGVLPVISVYTATRETAHEVLPDPPLYDVAKLNLLIYNKDSEIRDLERSQAFSILYVPSDHGGNMTISNHNVILVPLAASMAPGFISPDAGILRQLVDNNKSYMEDLFRSAEQYGVHAVQSSQSPSGVALAWRFWAVEHALRNTARIATQYENAVMDMLARYTGETYEYVVDYPMSYQPGNRSEEIKDYKTIIDMSPPRPLKSLIYQKVAKMVMADEPEDKQEEILKALEEAAEQVKPPVGPPPPMTPAVPEEPDGKGNEAPIVEEQEKETT